MTLLLLTMTVIVVLATTMYSYHKSKDPLAPLVIFCPMLLYVYVYAPWSVEANHGWDNFPRLKENLVWFYAVNLLSLTAFSGAAMGLSTVPLRGNSFTVRNLNLTPRRRSTLLRMGVLLGVIGAGSFWYLVFVNGGPGRVFARGKPFMTSGSGYIGEAQNLVYPALVLFALAWQGKRLTAPRILVALMVASPQLTMGTIGGRRGPAFLIFMTLAFCYFLIRQRQPTVRMLMGGLAFIGIFMFFLATQRREIFLGSNFEFDLSRTTTAISNSEVNEGHETVCAVAGIVTSDHIDRFFWGRRYATTLFVRPIPRQIWPSKYETVGMEWMESRPGSFGFSDAEWFQAVGFVPTRGNAPGFVTDMYIEFWYFGMAACAALGGIYRWTWNRARSMGGQWTLMYFMLLAFSVYLPSQSVQAWMVRLMVLAAPTMLLWMILIGRQKRKVASRKYG